MSTVSSSSKQIDKLAGKLIKKSNGSMDICTARIETRKKYPDLAHREAEEYRLEQQERARRTTNDENGTLETLTDDDLLRELEKIRDRAEEIKEELLSRGYVEEAVEG